MKQNNIASKQENQLTNEWHGLVFKVPSRLEKSHMIAYDFSYDFSYDFRHEIT